MKIGMQSRLYNAEIRNRRIELGLSQGMLAQKIGYGDGQLVCQAETFHIVDAKSPVIVKLAAFFDVTPETLCPPWLHMMEGIPTKADRQSEVTKPLLEQALDRQLALPYVQPSTQERDVDRETLSHTMKDFLHLLTPREQQVISLSFGLDGVERRTDKEVSKLAKCTAQRVRQCRLKAIWKLQKHPVVMRRLQAFCDMEPVKDPPKRAKRRPKKFIDVVESPVILPDEPEGEKIPREGL